MNGPLERFKDSDPMNEAIASEFARSVCRFKDSDPLKQFKDSETLKQFKDSDPLNCIRHIKRQTP
jgi:hypothetical protein